MTGAQRKSRWRLGAGSALVGCGSLEEGLLLVRQDVLGGAHWHGPDVAEWWREIEVLPRRLLRDALGRTPPPSPPTASTSTAVGSPWTARSSRPAAA